MKACYKFLLAGFSIFILSQPFIRAQEKTDNTGDNNKSINVFIDCRFCDYDYIIEEIEFVKYVRDRMQADVHILITRQSTGGGGREYTLTFIGQREFYNIEDTLKFVTIESDTDDKIRQEMVRVMKLGLIQFIADTPAADKISISYSKPEESVEVEDKWNSWVFSLSMSGWFNGERSFNSISTYGSIDAERVTEDIKLEFELWGNYDESNYSYGESKFSRYSGSRGFSGSIIPSLNNHWSLAFSWNIYSSTYSNKQLLAYIAPAIEYNIFPYSESTRRQLRLSYQFVGSYVDYFDKTVYNKHNEYLFKEALSATLEVIQPWGSASASLTASNYMHDFDRYRLTLWGSISVRVFEGFSIDLSGDVARVQDQVNLAKKDYSDEDILLRRHELLTSYNYWASVGITYSFGSIYSHVVNPRFGN